MVISGKKEKKSRATKCNISNFGGLFRVFDSYYIEVKLFEFECFFNTNSIILLK